MKGLFWVGTRVILLSLSPFVTTGRGQALPAAPTNSFVNWESAPVHPIAMSPDGQTLAVCNLPDNRLELFDLRNDPPSPLGAISVGLDPVSVRFRNDAEAWVVNKMSDSVSVVDTTTFRVRATLDTQRLPADIAFAGSPQRAFVTCTADNTVLVFDPDSLAKTNVINIDGDRPRSMAVSPDGATVYVAIFESGNASTILSPPFTDFGVTPGLGVVELPSGPYQGRNPPPNAGALLNPPLNPAISTNAALPRAELIVKKDAQGRWMDDNGGDWSPWVSGTNAALSGRVVGWDLPDHDVAVINAQSFSVSYISGLMNLCMDLAVNPASGAVTVVGTEALNNVRFEPVLNGKFVRVNLAIANASGKATVIKDLNPHLDYTTNFVAESLRYQSLGDPRGILWNSGGDRGYVTGMGSSNLVVINAAGDRIEPIAGLPVGSGPTGMALDEPRHRLYVFNRFDATVALVDALSATLVGRLKLFDPTPPVIKAGRPALYDTHKTSGLGQAACASCHPDARMDRLAWDLGNPAGQAISSITNRNYSPGVGLPGKDYHPMKGPMLTQTLQDIIGHEPFHWRGDRDGLEAFNPTFTNLQAAATALTTNEMQAFKDFLATIYFPPNRLRNFDHSLSTHVALPALIGFGTNGLLGASAPTSGDASHGAAATHVFCTICHTFPTGLGQDQIQIGTNLIPILPGPNGEHHLGLHEDNRDDRLPFKIQQLRTLGDRIGADFAHPTGHSGFGYFHDGRVDSLAHFIQVGYTGFSSDSEIADAIAYLLSLSGPDAQILLPQDNSQGLPGLYVPASVGRQITLNAPVTAPLLDAMLQLASLTAASNRVDLVAHGIKDGEPRGWFFDRVAGRFQSDRQAETLSPSDLLLLAGPGHELTYTVVPQESGRRIGIDRDGDGFLDRDELDLGSNPADPQSVPAITGASITFNGGTPVIHWNSAASHTYRVQWTETLSVPLWSDLAPDVTATGASASVSDPTTGIARTRYYRVRLVQ